MSDGLYKYEKKESQKLKISQQPSIIQGKVSLILFVFQLCNLVTLVIKDNLLPTQNNIILPAKQYLSRHLYIYVNFLHIGE